MDDGHNLDTSFIVRNTDQLAGAAEDPGVSRSTLYRYVGTSERGKAK